MSAFITCEHCGCDEVHYDNGKWISFPNFPEVIICVDCYYNIVEENLIQNDIAIDENH